MEPKQNYDKIMQAQIAALPEGARPSLLLHSCCAPCSSAVIERLAPHFSLTVFFYNPNIFPPEEYRHRLSEQRRLLAEWPGPRIPLIEAPYEPELFLSRSKGLEDQPEGGKRCVQCLSLRLEKTAVFAKAHGFDYFTTTLSVSPHKNAALLNQIGARLTDDTCQYLYADFKKRDGYRRSIALSREYGLYRQQFCGCRFSMRP